MARPRYSEVSVRDGDLLGTVAGGAIATLLVADVVSRAVSWPHFVLVGFLLPATCGLAWVFAGPSRLGFDPQGCLVHVGRLRRRQISLEGLTSIEHPGGRRKTALTFWDERSGVAIDLWDDSNNTEPFRRLLGEHIRSPHTNGVKIDKRAAELLFISEG